VKFFIIVGFLVIYSVLMVAYIVPVAIHNAFGQQFPQDQFNQQQQQFGNNQFDQQGQNQFGQQGQFGNDQFGSNQYQQQPYQQYGTSSYNQYPQSYGMYGQPPQYNNNYGGFNIQQILGYLLAAGGGTVGGKYAADRRTKSLEELHRETMEAELKTKTQLAELARVSFQKMPDGGTSIQDAPNVSLDNLKEDVDQFREKVAKA